MTARIYPWFVVLFWGVSMTWLLASKILPPLLGGHPPDYSLSLPPKKSESEPVCWRIAWNERRIGTAASKAIRDSDGSTALRQVVHFERLPLAAMLSESFGLFGSAMKPLLGGESHYELDMLLATELRFDQAGNFNDFHSVADLGEIRNFLRMRGVVAEGNLNLTTQFNREATGLPDQVLRHSVRLPREALVSDAFAPRPELKNLRVGQRWTIPIYRPFPPNSPVQIMEVVAERLDVIVWDAKDVETILLVYREEAGSGLHASREPVAREWVHADGAVLKREMRLSGLKVVFERLADASLEPEVKMLEIENHPRLWSGHSLPRRHRSSGIGS